mmetsp:Transcript_52659/g.167379  ORF Transcript_52659/g.167379 Transcript_52659/m.167379 type:complete len:104 (+) Transcript_52659:327-638(+)
MISSLRGSVPTAARPPETSQGVPEVSACGGDGLFWPGEDPPAPALPSLAEFLEVLGLGRYLEALEGQEVDMEALVLCTDADLAPLVPLLGPRVKIRNALAALR